jgi:CBS domain-containing protein
MKVADIMSRDVVSVPPSALLKDVARLLVRRRVSGVPVVAEDGTLVGVVSETDLVRKSDDVARHGEPPSNWLFGVDEREALKLEARTAAELMSRPPVTVESTATVAAAARLMAEHTVNRLPVVRDGHLVGIVSRADVVRAFARPDHELAEEIREQVLRSTLWIDPDSLELTVEGGVVRISGTVDTKTLAQVVPAYVATVPGVVAVDASKLRSRFDDLSRRGWRAFARSAR